jgi:hypothetical protein
LLNSEFCGGGGGGGGGGGSVPVLKNCSKNDTPYSNTSLRKIRPHFQELTNVNFGLELKIVIGVFSVFNMFHEKVLHNLFFLSMEPVIVSVYS